MNLRMKLTLALLILPVAPLPAEAQVPNSVTPQPAWMSILQQAKALHKEGKFAEAEVSARRALSIAKGYGPSDDRLAANYYLLATIERDRAHCTGARAGFMRALAVWERQSNPKPSYLFNAILSAINTASECADYNTAEKLFRAHGAELERYRSSPSDEAKLLTLRAALARSRKNDGQAEALLRQGLELLDHTSGSSTLELAQMRSSLAVVLGKLGRPAESLAESERALALFDQSGVRHPAIVASLNNAACALADLGRKDESEHMFQNALATASEMYGEENRVSASIMLNYARVLRENKQAPAATAMARKGAEAFHRSLAQDRGIVDVEDLRTNGK